MTRRLLVRLLTGDAGYGGIDVVIAGVIFALGIVVDRVILNR